MAAIHYIEPADRLAQAWQELRDLRRQRWEIDQAIVAAEARLDAERKRDTAGGEPLMSVRDAAVRLNVSESMLWKSIKAGNLHVTKVGRNTRVSPSNLEEFMQHAVAR